MELGQKAMCNWYNWFCIKEIDMQSLDNVFMHITLYYAIVTNLGTTGLRLSAYYSKDYNGFASLLLKPVMLL